MISVIRTVNFACSAEKAYDFIADAMNETKWNPELRSIEQLSSGSASQGTTYRGTYRQVGNVDFSITEYSRPKSVAFAGSGKRMNMKAGFRFQPVAGGTEMTIEVAIEPKGILKLFSPMMKGQMEKGLDLRYAALRKALESN